MSMPTVRVLLVEDDPRLATLTQTYLETRGLEVIHAANGEAALECLRKTTVTAVVLDLMLPGVDGYEVCRQLRTFSDVPVLMVTALDAEGDRVLGLEVGADDYICKPFSSPELLARIRACARRYLGLLTPQQSVLKCGALQLDPSRYAVTLSGRSIHLTAHEFRLLYGFAQRPGDVLSRERLLELTHNDPADAFDRSIDAHVSRLRSKLGDDPRRPRSLVTVRGVGYKLVPPDERSLSHR